MTIGSPLGGADADGLPLPDGFLPATLEKVRQCPAQADCVELDFRTPEGTWSWCFPRPSRERGHRPTPIALTLGPYGVLARRVLEAGLGAALDGAAVLPAILAGSDVIVARRLVAAGH